MVRFFAGLIGLFFSGMLLLALFDTIYLGITEPAEATAEHEFHKHAKDVSFAQDGPLGQYDRHQLQRGLKVFQEVCAACHSLDLIAFRNFEDLGYSKDQVKALAKQFQVASINPDTGEPATRDGLASDQWPAPYANEVAARAANNNALPPDLSLITKARHNGPAYVYSLLTGYGAQPAKLLKEFPDAKTPEGLHYNPYFANLNIAMAKPLSDGQVSFDDGSPNKVGDMAKDVSAFLAWTAQPELEVRRQIGWASLLFLLIFTVLAYLSYRSIWADKKH
ncbi:MAG: cytochrome c1 [Sphingorhabdus sp.]